LALVGCVVGLPAGWPVVGVVGVVGVVDVLGVVGVDGVVGVVDVVDVVGVVGVVGVVDVVGVPCVGVVLGWSAAGLVVVFGPTPTERVAPFGAEPEPTVAGWVLVEC
jgi:hypothetical protein